MVVGVNQGGKSSLLFNYQRINYIGDIVDDGFKLFGVYVLA